MAGPAVIPSHADLEEIQGLVYSGWNDHPYAGYVFARLAGKVADTRAWLDELRDRITPASRARRPRHGRTHVALAPGGLRALGVPDEVLAAVAQEAKDGMASRARILGDGDPASWTLRDGLDALVIVYGRDEAARDAMVAAERRALEAAGATVVADERSWPMIGREHFGFADGLSQPYLPGLHDQPRPGAEPVAAGEILLGYPNAYGLLPAEPRYRDLPLGRNGTYLVFRKLRQHVATLWGYLAERARELAPGDAEATTELLAAKLLGRWRSGAPLALSPDRDDPRLAAPDRVNAFGYLAGDPEGLRCPIASHVRRANPRDARGGSADDSATVVSRHRLLRRGRSFGPPLLDADARAGRDDGVPRGLYFISLQASIARGFEFVQQTWLSNPGFHGLCGEPDPIMGNGDGTAHFTIPAHPLRLRLSNVPRVVTVEGGGYFFLPSLPALAHLARPPWA